MNDTDTSKIPSYVYFKNQQLCHQNVYERLSELSKALIELQKKMRAKEESNFVHIEKELRERIQRETEKEWKKKFSKIEDKLLTAEEQLKILNNENNHLRHQLLLHSQSNSNFSRDNKIDSHIAHDNENSPHIPNGFIPNGGLNCVHLKEEIKINEKKLRKELRESEERADRLNIMFDEKLVELNKLQLAFSKRTKEMIHLERSYLQLVCYLYKNNHQFPSSLSWQNETMNSLQSEKSSPSNQSEKSSLSNQSEKSSLSNQSEKSSLSNQSEKSSDDLS